MIITENWAIVRFEGGITIGGRCHTDELGFGATSSPEKASGEKFCFDFGVTRATCLFFFFLLGECKRNWSSCVAVRLSSF